MVETICKKNTDDLDAVEVMSEVLDFDNILEVMRDE